jgi:hypothetical protein
MRELLLMKSNVGTKIETESGPDAAPGLLMGFDLKQGGKL